MAEDSLITSLFDSSPEPPKEERVEQAFQVWKQAQAHGSLISQSLVARQYNISRSTLVDRIHGRISAKERREALQKLSPGEEQALVEWICRLQKWGWPPRVEHVHRMAREILQKKGDNRPLGINYAKKFQDRHPELKTKILPPIDKDRTNAKDHTILAHWFSLFSSLKEEFNVQNKDIYNMDEKGFMQGVIPKLRVMISKYEKQKHVTQPGNREWVSLIECVSMDGRVLKPWIIFKAKQHQKAWYDVLKDGFIAVSENGWTDNEIGLTWLDQCFEKETAKTQQGKFRMLCVDGHASHITTAAIDFCIKHDIILLCLPAHTTDILQSLDVGVFAPLAIAYKNGIHEATNLGSCHWIDKVQFIEHYLTARQKAMTSKIITSAWRKVGLSLFDPQLILKDYEPPAEQHHQRLSFVSRPTTPAEETYSLSDNQNLTYSTAFTPSNQIGIQKLIRQVKEGLDLNLAFRKLTKAADHAMADAVIQSKTNDELMERSKQNDRKKGRTKGNYGTARVMNAEVIQQRLEDQADKNLRKQTMQNEKEQKKEEKERIKEQKKEEGERKKKKKKEEGEQKKKERECTQLFKQDFGQLLRHADEVFSAWKPLKKQTKKQMAVEQRTAEQIVAEQIAAEQITAEHIAAEQMTAEQMRSKQGPEQMGRGHRIKKSRRIAD